jgi:hypothetical protein
MKRLRRRMYAVGLVSWLAIEITNDLNRPGHSKLTRCAPHKYQGILTTTIL